MKQLHEAMRMCLWLQHSEEEEDWETASLLNLVDEEEEEECRSGTKFRITVDSLLWRSYLSLSWKLFPGEQLSSEHNARRSYKYTLQTSWNCAPLPPFHTQIHMANQFKEPVYTFRLLILEKHHTDSSPTTGRLPPNTADVPNNTSVESRSSFKSGAWHQQSPGPSAWFTDDGFTAWHSPSLYRHGSRYMCTMPTRVH